MESMLSMKKFLKSSADSIVQLIEIFANEIVCRNDY